MATDKKVLIIASEIADPTLLRFIRRELALREIAIVQADSGTKETLSEFGAMILVCTGEASLPARLRQAAEQARAAGLPLFWCLRGLQEQDIPTALMEDPCDRVIVVMDDDTVHLFLTDFAQGVVAALQSGPIPPATQEVFDAIMNALVVDETSAESLLAGMEQAATARRVAHEFEFLNRTALIRLATLRGKLASMLQPFLVTDEAAAWTPVVDRWQHLCDEANELDGAIRARMAHLVIAMQARDAEGVLRAMESAWKKVAEPDSACFELAPVVRSVVANAFAIVKSAAIEKANEGEPEMARAWGEQAAKLAREMGEVGECAVMTALVSICLGLQDSTSHLAPPRMEEALRMAATAGTAQHREWIISAEDDLYRILSQRTERLMDRGSVAAAADLARSLVRLARAMPGQQRLAEALACAAALADHAHSGQQTSARLAYEARALAEFHDLPPVAEAMHDLVQGWSPPSSSAFYKSVTV